MLPLTQTQKRQLILSERERRIVEARKSAAAAGRRLAAAYRAGSVARPRAPASVSSRSAAVVAASPVIRRRPRSPTRSQRMASPPRSPRRRQRSPSPTRSVRLSSPRRRQASPDVVMLDEIMAPQIEVVEMKLQSAEMKIASVLTPGMLGTVEQINRHYSAFPLSGNKAQKTEQIISMLRDGKIQCANLQKMTLVAAGNKIVGRGTFSESDTLEEICSRITATV